MGSPTHSSGSTKVASFRSRDPLAARCWRSFQNPTVCGVLPVAVPRNALGFWPIAAAI